MTYKPLRPLHDFTVFGTPEPSAGTPAIDRLPGLLYGLRPSSDRYAVFTRKVR